MMMLKIMMMMMTMMMMMMRMKMMMKKISQFCKRLLDLLLVVRSHKLSTTKICQKIAKEQPATRTPLHVIC